MLFIFSKWRDPTSYGVQPYTYGARGQVRVRVEREQGAQQVQLALMKLEYYVYVLLFMVSRCFLFQNI